MPTPDVERALAAGAERSRAAAAGSASTGRARRPVRGGERSANRLAAWFASLPPERRKLIIGIGLFLLFDLIAGLAAVTMGTHF